MRCPYCGCKSGGCGFCEVEGWENDVAGMEEPATLKPKVKENTKEPDFFRLSCELLGYSYPTELNQ